MSFDTFFDDLEMIMEDAPMPAHSEEEQRRMAFQRASEDYTAKFEEAYARREERRKADTTQWLKISLPKIKEEARLCAYERKLAAINHTAVV
jgi:hypothetical protein